MDGAQFLVQIKQKITHWKINKKGQKVLDPDVPFNAVPKPYDLGIFASRFIGLKYQNDFL